MKTLIIIIVSLFLVTHLVMASSFTIDLKPHFYLDEEEKLINESYDKISFEVIGTNFRYNRILNLSINSSSPEIFQESLNMSIQILRILQNKTLWVSDMMIINDFPYMGNVTFFIEVEGVDEKTNEKLIETDTSIIFIKEFKPVEKRMSVSEFIWEGSPENGSIVLVIFIFLIMYASWYYEWPKKLSKNRTKSRENRILRKDYEKQLSYKKQLGY